MNQNTEKGRTKNFKTFLQQFISDNPKKNQQSRKKIQFS